MPFAYLRIPSIGITQLKTVLDQQFGDSISTELHYLNIDVAQFFDFDLYNFIAEDSYAQYCNFGEWYFRQEAFPELQDNTKEYFKYFGLQMEGMLLNHDDDIFHLRKPKPSNELIFYVNVLLDKRADLGKFLDSLIVKNRLHEADVVGFSSLFQQNVPCFALARRLKTMNPDITIVMGGSNCESPMGEEIIQTIETIDYVFSGPALKSLPKFLQHLKIKDHIGCNGIDGVFSRQNLSTITYASTTPDKNHTSDKQGIATHGEELNINHPINLEYHDFIDTLSLKTQPNVIKPILLFETSRGCWWGEKSHCVFCGLNTDSMNYRSIDADIALEYLNCFFKTYGEKVKQFSSVDNIMPNTYVKEVFPEMQVPDDCSIFYEVKSNLNREQLEVMAKSRVLTVQPGIESFNSETLQLMRKGVKGIQNIQFLKNAKSAGIQALWNLIIGFPGETERSFEPYDFDGNLLFHLDPPKGVSLVRFDRFSPYFNSYDQYGLNIKPQDHYGFMYPEFQDDRIARLAYFFKDDNNEAPYQVLAEKWYGRFQHLVNRWKKRHEEQHEVGPPQLIFQDELSILDTRSTRVVMHHISEIQRRLLKSLAKPKAWKVVIKDHEDMSLNELNENLKLLIEKQLVYHEDWRYFVALILEDK